MKKREVTIVIATNSNDKIQGIKEAFLQFFPEDKFELKVYSGQTESGVPEQPFGDDTYQGAYNRINSIRKKYENFLKEQDIAVDFYVSCEAGIDNTNNVIVDCKVTPIYTSEQIVCVYDSRSSSYFFGKSSSWTVPTQDIEEIRNTNLDYYLRNRKCTGLHDVGNGKYISRKEAIMEGTKSAIASCCFFDRCNHAKLDEKVLDQDIDDYEVIK